MSSPEAVAVIALKSEFVYNDFTVACIAVLFYDHLITLADEIELMWGCKWSFVKLLFFMNRYLQPVFLLAFSLTATDPRFPKPVCGPWFYIDQWEGVIVEYVVNLMLLMRTWALWDRNRKVLIALILVFAITMGSYTFGAVWGSVQRIRLEGNPATFIHPCLSDIRHPEELYSIWVALIAWDSFVIALLFSKVIPLVSQGLTSPLIKQIFVDGYLFFFAIAISSLANILMIRFAPGQLATMMFTYHRVIATVLCSRMVLNLRGSLLRPLDLPASACSTSEYEVDEYDSTSQNVL